MSLEGKSMAELVAHYNDLGPEKAVTKFKDKRTAVARIQALAAQLALEEELFPVEPAVEPRSGPGGDLALELTQRPWTIEPAVEPIVEPAGEPAGEVSAVPGTHGTSAECDTPSAEPKPRGEPIVYDADGRSLPGEGYEPILDAHPGVIHKGVTTLLLVEPPLSYQQILVEIRHWFPISEGNQTSVKCLRWYASRLREEKRVLYRPKSPREVK